MGKKEREREKYQQKLFINFYTNGEFSEYNENK